MNDVRQKVNYHQTDTLPLVSGPGVWRGPDMAERQTEWNFVLTPSQVGELDAAVAAVKDRDVVDVRFEDFPLPELGKLLAKIRKDVLFGRGFSLIRGVPVDRYTKKQAALAYWGIGTHLGEAVSQNGKGHVLGHVTDLGRDYYGDPTARGYQTAARLPYHTDSSDLVCLLSLKTSKSGGASSIVSSLALYNEIVKTRPDLAAVLAEPTYRDRRGEIPEGKDPWYRLPVFNVFDGHVAIHYVRSAIRKAQRFDDVPRLTDLQEEAFDYLDSLADSPEFHLDMTFQPGDIQILSNYQILHSRTAYVDHDEPEKKRHLLRLWLGCDDGPPIPPYMMAEQQGATRSGRPNGIQVPGVPLNAPLDPC